MLVIFSFNACMALGTMVVVSVVGGLVWWASTCRVLDDLCATFADVV